MWRHFLLDDPDTKKVPGRIGVSPLVSLLNRSIQDLLSFGSWCVKGTEESTSRLDSSVPLTHHDPRDLGLICLVKKRKIHFRILSDFRIQSCISLKKHTLSYTIFGLLRRGKGNQSPLSGESPAKNAVSFSAPFRHILVALYVALLWALREIHWPWLDVKRKGCSIQFTKVNLLSQMLR